MIVDLRYPLNRIKQPLNVFNLGAIASFNPSSLFASSEYGAFYDPSDLTSLYVETDGGDNSTVGDFVGLMLDKRLMGGQTAAAFIAAQPELAGTYASFISPAWTASGGWTANGDATATFTAGASDGNVSFAGLLSDTTFYHLEFTIANLTSGSINVRIGDASFNDLQVTADGTYELITKPESGTSSVTFRGASITGTSPVISALTIKEIPGNHAVAPSDVARPTLQATALATASTTGGELVTNGTFDVDSDWTKGTGWTISGGSAICDGTQVSSSILGGTSIVLASPGPFIAEITVSAVTGTGVRFEPFSDTSLGYINSPGTYTYVVQGAAGSNTLNLRAAAGSTATLDNISVQEVSAADYLYYLDFDGVEDFMTFGVAAERNNSSIFLGISAGASETSYAAAILVPDQVIYAVGTGNKWSHYATTEGASSYDLRATPSVIALLAATNSDVVGRTNGVEEDITTGAFNSRGTVGALGSATVGGSQYGAIQIYGVVLRHDADLTEDEKNQIDTWLASKSGVTL